MGNGDKVTVRCTTNNQTTEWQGTVRQSLVSDGPKGRLTSRTIVAREVAHPSRVTTIFVQNAEGYLLPNGSSQYVFINGTTTPGQCQVSTSAVASRGAPATATTPKPAQPPPEKLTIAQVHALCINADRETRRGADAAHPAIARDSHPATLQLVAWAARAMGVDPAYVVATGLQETRLNRTAVDLETQRICPLLQMDVGETCKQQILKKGLGSHGLFHFLRDPDTSGGGRLWKKYVDDPDVQSIWRALYPSGGPAMLPGKSALLDALVQSAFTKDAMQKHHIAPTSPSLTDIAILRLLHTNGKYLPDHAAECVETRDRRACDDTAKFLRLYEQVREAGF